MKHRIAGRRLDRTTEHRTAMFRNLVTSLFRHERITTTTPKAKELKRFADKFITLAKQGTQHARRLANRDVRDVRDPEQAVPGPGPALQGPAGGYTPRHPRGPARRRRGADMSVIELVDRPAGAAAERRGEGGRGEGLRRPTRWTRPARGPRSGFDPRFDPRREHMAVVLRLCRAGTHKAPFYHVVATDSRKRARREATWRTWASTTPRGGPSASSSRPSASSTG